ncbi:unnamed protein product [Calypogeia fissa]
MYPKRPFILVHSKYTRGCVKRSVTGSELELAKLPLRKTNQIASSCAFTSSSWGGGFLVKPRVEVLDMAVDRIRKRASLNKILAMKEVPEDTILENPYLGSGHAPYENFIDSLLKVTDTSTTVGKELFDDAGEAALTCVEKLGLRTVFHSTDHSFMISILKSGLDPECRLYELREDYIGFDYATGLGYTTNEWEDGSKLLVFLVIKDPDNHHDDLRNGELTVESNESELLLAEITIIHSQ